MSAWTPGPWEFSATDSESHAVVSPPIKGEKDVGPWFTAIVISADDGVETANARLMAAAPDLYKTLLSFRTAVSVMVAVKALGSDADIESATARMWEAHDAAHAAILLADTGKRNV